jgi:uncharacterized protein involved in outer membrane biogenesis
VLGAAAVVAGLALAAALALPWLLDLPQVHAWATQAASQALGRPVRMGRLSLALLPAPAVRLQDLEVAEDPRFGPAPLLRVADGRLRLRFWPLLRGRLEPVELVLDGARLRVVEDRGRLNLAALGGGGPGRASGRAAGGPAAAGPVAALPVPRIELRRATVELERRATGGTAALRLEDLELSVGGTAAEALTLAGRATVQPGALRLVLADAALAPAGRAPAEAALRGVLSLEAADLGAVLAPLTGAAGLHGPVAGRLALGGALGRPTARGELTGPRLELRARPAGCGPAGSRPLPLEALRAPVALASPRLDSAPASLRTAGGTVTAAVSLDWTAAPRLSLRAVEVRGVQLGPILVELLCQAFAVTGPLDLSGEAALGLAAPLESLDGAGRLRLGPGQIVGAGALEFLADVLRLAAVLSAPGEPLRARPGPVAFDSITGSFTIRAGVLRSDDLVLTGPTAVVRTAGSYGLADTRVNLAVTVVQGRTEVRAEVTGTTAPRALRVRPVSVRAGERDAVRRLLERMLR